MNRTFYAFHGDNCYEVRIRDFNIVRILKHTENGLFFEVQFDNLSPTVQEVIIERLGEVLMEIDTKQYGN